MDKILSPRTKLEQLAILMDWISKYSIKHPRNSGMYQTNIGQKVAKPIRDGIILYSRGHGWRLRQNWHEVIWTRNEEYHAELNKIPPDSSSEIE